MSAEAETQALEAAKKAQEAAYASMIEAHDRIMPMMGQVTASQRAIKEAVDAPGTSKDQEELLGAAYEQLEDAEDGMMSWMKNMKPLDNLRESMDNEAIVKYIEEQTSEITGVEVAIKTAVATAKELVGDHADHNHGADGHDHSGHKH